MYSLQRLPEEQTHSKKHIANFLHSVDRNTKDSIKYSLRMSEFVYGVFKDSVLIALFGYKQINEFTVFLGTFYVLPNYRLTKAIIPILKLSSEVLVRYTEVRYIPMIGRVIPLKYCNRRTIDVRKAYKDTHG